VIQIVIVTVYMLAPCVQNADWGHCIQRCVQLWRICFLPWVFRVSPIDDAGRGLDYWQSCTSHLRLL